MAQFTTIDHDVRRLFDITLNEYAVCDSVYHLSRNQGCDASKSYIAEFIGISRKSIHQIIKKMIEDKGLIEKSSARLIRTTDKWNDAIMSTKRIDSVTKGYSQCNERLQSTVTKGDIISNERLHNKDISINNKNSIYALLVDMFFKEYEAMYKSKPAFTNKDFKNIKDIIALAEKTENPEKTLKTKMHIFSDNCKNEKGTYWRLVPGKMLSGWNELVKHEQKKKHDPIWEVDHEQAS